MQRNKFSHFWSQIKNANWPIIYGTSRTGRLGGLPPCSLCIMTLLNALSLNGMSFSALSSIDICFYDHFVTSGRRRMTLGFRLDLEKAVFWKISNSLKKILACNFVRAQCLQYLPITKGVCHSFSQYIFMIFEKINSQHDTVSHIFTKALFIQENH